MAYKVKKKKFHEAGTFEPTGVNVEDGCNRIHLVLVNGSHTRRVWVFILNFGIRKYYRDGQKKKLI